MKRSRYTHIERGVVLLALAAPAWAQSPPPVDRVTFQQAIDRATTRNPTLAVAAAGILRAEGLLQQARAATLPAVNAFYSNSTLDTGRSFSGVVVQPRNQSTISADLSVPVLAASRRRRPTLGSSQRRGSSR